MGNQSPFNTFYEIEVSAKGVDCLATFLHCPYEWEPSIPMS